MGQDLVWLSNHLGLIDELDARFRENDKSVDQSWHGLLSNGATELPEEAFAPHPLPLHVTPSREFMLSAWPVINAYRAHGHLAASIDPLGLMERTKPAALEPLAYDFGEHPDTLPVYCGGVLGLDVAPLGEVVKKLRKLYCGNIGFEYMHIADPGKKKWLAERVEVPATDLSPETRKLMLRQLIAAEGLEQFFHVKYPGTKRFSLEGGETLIPLIEQVLDQGAAHGAIEAVLGMAHRGRLNVLNQVMKRRAREMFADFEDAEPETALGGGDVKYHLGYSCDREFPSGGNMHLSLAFNPSHLEAVDPVVCGRVRAKQRRHGDWPHEKIMGLLIHGDAAFAGQGLVPETLNLSNLYGYRTGGTVHVIVNNQIGFTASPDEARSTPYCSDVAKMIECPIFHVNAEDMDNMARVVKLAMEYRARFKSDVVIDMVCWRKFGHNEMDEPDFTNPVMYAAVRKKESIVTTYSNQLLQEKVLTEDDIDAMRTEIRAEMEEELAIAKADTKRPKINAMRGIWSVFKGGADVDAPDVDTGVSLEKLTEISKLVTTIPSSCEAHRKVRRLFGQRAEMGEGKRALDWGMAETLAYGSLLMEKTDVRLTGQDSCRGTFSHRHAIIVDVKTGEEYMPLSNLHPEQGQCRIYDSPLSEAGVLGFEYGYSLDSPDSLVLWEAQFGDFANGAQVIIDQFVVASEDKWNRLSGLTMLLPHGYEGQGPEHSSSRIERFLNACGEDNIQVCQPSTPAQIFHLLRRQVKRPLRKPLVVFTPKSLLRLPAAGSDISELTSGSYQRFIADGDVTAPSKVLFCSGRIYFDLAKRKAEGNHSDVEIIRIEQLYPFREDALAKVLPKVSRNVTIRWVQDEPANMGPGNFVVPRLSKALGQPVEFVSREESASPATGSHKAHVMEQDRLIAEAFA